ncbi:hypothetical protein CPC08DRAFT_762073 [Agrocybe pediades]|nr:hypothetical protein CPC08DRAFT_762073 [Agrocybe pediades]
MQQALFKELNEASNDYPATESYVPASPYKEIKNTWQQAHQQPPPQAPHNPLAIPSAPPAPAPAPPVLASAPPALALTA